MVKRLIKKLVACYQQYKLAYKKLLRQQHNNQSIKSILKDFEERN